MTNKQSGSSVTVPLMMLLLMMMMVGMVVEVTAAYECQQMRGECRLETEEKEGMLKRNISCLCTHGEEVSHLLGQLSRVNCMKAAGRNVSTSILHINGCTVSSKVFPKSLLATCRGSTHFVLHVEDCPWVSLTSPAPSAAGTLNPTTITATFLHSNVSGMPAGLVSDASEQAVIRVEGGQMSVIESYAFSGYSRDAQVSVTFRNTEIHNVKQGAFDLPPAARMEVEGGTVFRFQRHSYSGGGELTLSGVKVANLMSSSINIHGVKKLNVTNCVMATVYAHVLEHRPPSYNRNIMAGQEVLQGSEVTFSDNSFITGNGHAFAKLCTVDRLSWHNNTILTSNDMPLRLQSPDCSTQRDWSLVFSLNRLSCENCSNFNNTDKQTCGLYESSYCISCEKAMDECYKPVLPYLITKCLASHPHIATSLKNTCRTITTTPRSPRALQNKEGKDAALSLRAPLVLVVTLAVTVLLAMPE